MDAEVPGLLRSGLAERRSDELCRRARLINSYSMQGVAWGGGRSQIATQEGGKNTYLGRPCGRGQDAATTKLEHDGCARDRRGYQEWRFIATTGEMEMKVKPALRCLFFRGALVSGDGGCFKAQAQATSVGKINAAVGICRS